MNNNIGRTTSTNAIWVCTAVIFVAGVFRFNWNGLPAGFLWMIVALALAIAPAAATQAI